MALHNSNLYQRTVLCGKVRGHRGAFCNASVQNNYVDDVSQLKGQLAEEDTYNGPLQLVSADGYPDRYFTSY